MIIEIDEQTVKRHRIDLDITIDELYKPLSHTNTQMIVVKCSTFAEDSSVYDKITDYLNDLQSKIIDDIKTLYY